MRSAFQHQPRYLLDEQRDPARADGDTFERIGGKRIALGNGADHLAHLVTIERNQRNDPMVRARRPRGAKFGARRREDHQGRGRSSLGEHLQEVERGRIGPVEVFEGEHERLRASARKQPGDHCGELAASQFVGRKFGRTKRRGGNVEQGRKQRRKLDRIELHLRQRGIEVGKTAPRRDVDSPKSLPAPLGQRMQRGVLQQLRRGPLDPGMGPLGKPATKLIDETRLAESGLANDLDELSVAVSRTLPALGEQREIVVSPDERRLYPRAGAPAAAAGADDPMQDRRTRNALEFVRAFVFNDEQACDLSPHGRRDEHRSGIGGALHASGEVGSVAKHLARGIHDDGTAVQPDASGEGGSPRAALATFKSSSARRTPKPARAARSASFSCALGYPNSAMSPSPSFLATWPPYWPMALAAASR